MQYTDNKQNIIKCKLAFYTFISATESVAETAAVPRHLQLEKRHAPSHQE